jgi:hypothetical protein
VITLLVITLVLEPAVVRMCLLVLFLILEQNMVTFVFLWKCKIFLPIRDVLVEIGVVVPMPLSLLVCSLSLLVCGLALLLR